MTIKMNLSLMSRRPSKYLKYLYRWAKERKNGIQVICENLEFGAIPAYDPLDILKVFDAASIQELAINTRWDIYTLASLAPGVGQMKNLQKLIFMNIRRPDLRDLEEARIVTEIFSEFSKLHKLQHLYVNDVYFLTERLDQMLRCFESPLETLAVTHYTLSESDMRYLSQCSSIHQLKHLDLSGVTLSRDSDCAGSRR